MSRDLNQRISGLTISHNNLTGGFVPSVKLSNILSQEQDPLTYDPTFSSRNDHYLFGSSQTYREQTRSSVDQLSALQSNRTYNNIYSGAGVYEPSPLVSGRQYGLNLESTQELRAFVTIDLAKINNDRQNQLKLALEDNYRDKESQLLEVEASYKKQRDEYNAVTMKLDQKSKLLDNELAKQRECMNELKNIAAKIEVEQQQNEKNFHARQKESMQMTEQVKEKLIMVNSMLRAKESEKQMLQFEQQNIEQRIDLKQRIKMQQLDLQVQPLADEKEQYVLNLELLEQNRALLQSVKVQNDNERTMISEDLVASNQQKLELIYQREDIEQYIDKSKNENPDLQFLTSNFDENIVHYPKWGEAIQALVCEKQRCLLLDLIRELHQYILGVSSNTTDVSVMQSDELEELQGLIENKQILLHEAAELLSDFASNKIKIDLSVEVLQSKLDGIAENIDNDTLRDQLLSFRDLELQMSEIDQRIKVITNRCQNDLVPRERALTISESTLEDEISAVLEQIELVRAQLDQVEERIDEAKIIFQQTMPLQTEDDEAERVTSQVLREQVIQLAEAIEEAIQQINDLIETKSDLEKRLSELEYDKQYNAKLYEEKNAALSERYNSILNDIKKEKSTTLQFEFTNPHVQQLTRDVAQLKCDKESSYKRLKYIETKVTNAKDSVMHAKQVLDDHVLQIQQDQLNNKVTTQSHSYIQFKKRVASQNQCPNIEASKVHNHQNQSNLIQKSVCIPRGTSILGQYEEDFQNREHVQKSEILPSRLIHQQQKHIPFERKPHPQFIEPLDDIDSKSAIGVMKQIKLQTIDAQIGPKSTQLSSLSEYKSITEEDNGMSKLLSQKNKEIIQAYLNREKSDTVNYKYHNSSVSHSQTLANNSRGVNEALSSSQISSSQYKNQIAQTLRQMNPNSCGESNSRTIPIQTFITPRDPMSEMQHNHSHQQSLVSQQNQYEIGQFGTYRHSQSIGSADDENLQQHIAIDRRNSLNILSTQSVQMNESPALQTLQSTLQHSVSQYQNAQGSKAPSVKISLRHTQNNSVDDANNQQSLANSMRSSMTYKENVAPNIMLSSSQTYSSLNLRKLSQAASLTSLQSINKPPAVPSSKGGASQPFYILSDTLQSNNDSQKKQKQPVPHQSHTHRSSKGQLEIGLINISSQPSQFNSNRTNGSLNSIGMSAVTKMRLCQNSNNGKILGTGIVDLSKCNQSLVQKDIQFFESVKPLIEGASFLCQSSKHGNSCHTKYIYLDFSLLRLFLNLNNVHAGSSDRREVLMIDSIIKTDLPQSTLEMINQEKQNQQTTMSSDHYYQSTFGSGKRYEFQIILNNNGIAERIQLYTHSFEELRQWVIGLNALIQNKNNLMRLSSMIKTT